MVCVQRSSCTDADTIGCYADKDNDLVSPLATRRLQDHSGKDASDAGKSSGTAAVLLLNANYLPGKARQLTDTQKQLIHNSNCASSPNTQAFLRHCSAKPEKIEFETHRGRGQPAPELLPMDLLSVNRGWYIRERRKAADADARGCPIRLCTDWKIPCMRRSSTNPTATCGISTSQLSDFARIRFAPEFRWKAFLGNGRRRSGRTEGDVQIMEIPGRSFLRRKQELLTGAVGIGAERREWFFNVIFWWLHRWKADCRQISGRRTDTCRSVASRRCGGWRRHVRHFPKDIARRSTATVAASGHKLLDGNDVQGEVDIFAAGNHRQYHAMPSLRQIRCEFLCSTASRRPRNDLKAPPTDSGAGLGTGQGNLPHDDNARSDLGMASGSRPARHQWDRRSSRRFSPTTATDRCTRDSAGASVRSTFAEYGWRHYCRLELVNPHPHFESWMWACYLWLSTG